MDISEILESSSSDEEEGAAAETDEEEEKREEKTEEVVVSLGNFSHSSKDNLVTCMPEDPAPSSILLSDFNLLFRLVDLPFASCFYWDL